MVRRSFLAVSSAAVLHGAARNPSADARLRGAFRRPEQKGWTFVHLEGTPGEIGFQHGYLLSKEIEEGFKIIQLELTHDSGRNWNFFRDTLERELWPKVPAEYREEIEGIAAGLNARGVALDPRDIAAMNAWLEWPYYLAWLDGKPHPIAERCSAFVATGSYTRDRRPVIAHNAWTSYMDGARWSIVLDIVPAAGHRMIMDGYPGLIHSGDDFGINTAGLMITETTISRFEGWNPAGTPEFVRARKAMQYASSINEFAQHMMEGNNGGYANNWLVADRKTNEVASVELGLKWVNVSSTKDGYFVGANFPVDEKLAKEETKFDLTDPALSPNARRARWEQLMKEHRGSIDTAAARRFLADHYDMFEKRTQPNERTLCGHIDLSPRGVEAWQPKFGPAGAVQNKVADARMAERMSFDACMGHACGIKFSASQHLSEHPDFNWQKAYLKDLPSFGWTSFKAG